MMTIEGAYIMFRDEEVGSLEPGTTDLEAVRNIEVWMTMVGGHAEWCAPTHEEFCPA